MYSVNNVGLGWFLFWFVTYLFPEKNQLKINYFHIYTDFLGFSCSFMNDIYFLFTDNNLPGNKRFVIGLTIVCNTELKFTIKMFLHSL